LGAPIWVFLGGGCSVENAPAYEGLIVLDFLGFFRPDRDLSMGYTRFSRVEFFSTLSLALAAPGTGAGGRGHAEGRFAHQASLNQVLLFRNKMSTLMSVADDMSGLESV
jgi:hypothetical protein